MQDIKHFIFQIFIPVLFLVVGPDIFLYIRYINDLSPNTLFHILICCIWFMPSLLLMAAWICLFVDYHHHISMRMVNSGILIFAIPKFVFFILQFLSFWVASGTTAMVLSLFIFGLTRGWKMLQIRKLTCHSTDLPEAFDGYRIVQLTDLHLGTFGNRQEYIQRIVEETNRLHPDLIVFTGDLINNDSQEMLPYMQTLSKLEARDGIYSILGNHDYGEYGNDHSYEYRKRTLSQLIRLQEQIGWKVLRDESIKLSRNNQHIYLVGVENISLPPFPRKGNLDKALQGIAEKESGKNNFIILLSHDPNHWKTEVLRKTSIQLTLSGHTHGAQLRFGKITPARFAFRYWGGKFVENRQMLYVSLGLGGAFQFRLGAWPELAQITLHNSDDGRYS